MKVTQTLVYWGEFSFPFNKSYPTVFILQTIKSSGHREFKSRALLPYSSYQHRVTTKPHRFPSFPQHSSRPGVMCAYMVTSRLARAQNPARAGGAAALHSSILTCSAAGAERERERERETDSERGKERHAMRERERRWSALFSLSLDALVLFGAPHPQHARLHAYKHIYIYIYTHAEPLYTRRHVHRARTRPRISRIYINTLRRVQLHGGGEKKEHHRLGAAAIRARNNAQQQHAPATARRECDRYILD